MRGIRRQRLNRAGVGEWNPRVRHLGRVGPQLHRVHDGTARQGEQDADLAASPERVARCQGKRTTGAVGDGNFAATLNELSRRVVELNDT